MPVRDLDVWIEPAHPERLYAELEEKGRVYGFETQFRPSDGTTIDVLIYSEILELDGETVILTVNYDDSARKQAEREFAIAKEKAEIANRSKSEFLASMSHELRTPLNAVIGFSQALESGMGGSLSEKQREYVGDIRSSGEHLLTLIGGLLDISKIELGEIDIVDEQVDLTECVSSCIRLVDERVRGRLTISTRGLDDLPLILGDRTRVKQVLLNLLTNSIKFTDAGGTITVEGDVSKGGSVCLKVSDTGIGMSSADIEKALSIFGKVDTARDRNIEGSGLGLPICKSLMEQHEGTLDIESKPGVGTNVTLMFPSNRVIRNLSRTA